jgi:hypothetical protein
MLDANDRTVVVIRRVLQRRGSIATAADETETGPTGGPECPLTS